VASIGLDQAPELSYASINGPQRRRRNAKKLKQKSAKTPAKQTKRQHSARQSPKSSSTPDTSSAEVIAEPHEPDSNKHSGVHLMGMQRHPTSLATRRSSRGKLFVRFDTNTHRRTTYSHQANAVTHSINAAVDIPCHKLAAGAEIGQHA
jgi:hypothetical protein